MFTHTESRGRQGVHHEFWNLWHPCDIRMVQRLLTIQWTCCCCYPPVISEDPHVFPLTRNTYMEQPTLYTRTVLLPCVSESHVHPAHPTPSNCFWNTPPSYWRESGSTKLSLPPQGSTPKILANTQENLRLLSEDQTGATTSSWIVLYAASVFYFNRFFCNLHFCKQHGITLYKPFINQFTCRRILPTRRHNFFLGCYRKHTYYFFLPYEPMKLANIYLY